MKPYYLNTHILPHPSHGGILVAAELQNRILTWACAAGSPPAASIAAATLVLWTRAQSCHFACSGGQQLFFIVVLQYASEF